ncbi:hypothetical protein L596_014901 [Steinernema carpocapsae]|uniref:Uncharacterized protein n=1 Tax=Steinernema carpocapsae TaxID=34508 RepID=A0A4U5NE64_STECR|nr:hypothetical protein L596_014901 [Steinernema carpocapsae]
MCTGRRQSVSRAAKDEEGNQMTTGGERPVGDLGGSAHESRANRLRTMKRGCRRHLPRTAERGFASSHKTSGEQILIDHCYCDSGGVGHVELMFRLLYKFEQELNLFFID